MVNQAPVVATGRLRVDSRAGTKDGTVVYRRRPGPVAPGPGCTAMATGKCFIGARRIGRAGSAGPIEMLGQEFTSMRVTRLGKHGTFCVSESATIKEGRLWSDMIAVGEYHGPPTRGMGPLRETIRVLEDGTMESEGRYTLIPVRGRAIRVTYVHFYRPARPDRRVLARVRGRRYELKATISPDLRGRTLHYHSVSTLTELPG